MNKPRIIRDYTKVSEEIKEQIKLVYPRGFKQHLISFSGQNGTKYTGLPLETEESFLIIKMSKVDAIAIVQKDDDFDDDGILKEEIKSDYEDKYEDVEYLSEHNENDDNDLG